MVYTKDLKSFADRLACSNHAAGTKMQFTNDEIETIKNLIKDFGFEYGVVSDLAKVRELAKKLNMDKHYTEEL